MVTILVIILLIVWLFLMRSPHNQFMHVQFCCSNHWAWFSQISFQKGLYSFCFLWFVSGKAWLPDAMDCLIQSFTYCLIYLSIYWFLYLSMFYFRKGLDSWCHGSSSNWLESFSAAFVSSDLLLCSSCPDSGFGSPSYHHHQNHHQIVTINITIICFIIIKITIISSSSKSSSYSHHQCTMCQAR